MEEAALACPAIEVFAARRVGGCGMADGLGVALYQLLASSRGSRVVVASVKDYEVCFDCRKDLACHRD